MDDPEYHSVTPACLCEWIWICWHPLLASHCSCYEDGMTRMEHLAALWKTTMSWEHNNPMFHTSTLSLYNISPRHETQWRGCLCFRWQEKSEKCKLCIKNPKFNLIIFNLILYATVSYWRFLICKSLWMKTSAKRLNVHTDNKLFLLTEVSSIQRF